MCNERISLFCLSTLVEIVRFVFSYVKVYVDLAVCKTCFPERYRRIVQRFIDLVCNFCSLALTTITNL